MPSIRQELETTRTARWYQHASGTPRAGAWADRERDYAALRAVLAEHTGALATTADRHEGPPVQLAGLLSLVAKRAHYAGAEPVYRRYRGKQQGAQILRWAGPESAMRPSAAFLAEARIAAFWPYREGVLEVADAFDMTRVEWATAYLRALAAWAADNRPLAAYAPGGPPPCVPEDMAVITGVRAPSAAGPAAAQHAERLAVLAGDVVGSVLGDVGITPLDAFGTVRDEVRSLLSPSPESLADQILRAAAELSDRMSHGISMAPDQARRLQGRLASLATLLGQQTGAQQEGGAEGFLREA
ncbi:MAG TPA: hypothetical protein VFO01_09645 [Trebonia sp.]|nr:hypothetical protein [Trebonia sp.]